MCYNWSPKQINHIIPLHSIAHTLVMSPKQTHTAHTSVMSPKQTLTAHTSVMSPKQVVWHL